MLDPKNSTQISNSKGETKTRPTPIGGTIGFFEEKEPELGAILEKCMSAIGGLPTPDFQPIKFISSIFGKDTWTAITDLGTQLIGSEKPKSQPKPEDKKKMEDGLVLRQALEVIENARISNAQQEMHKSDSEAERILGRQVSMAEASRKLNKSTSFTGLSGRLSYYDLVELRRIETEEEKQAKQAKMQQTLKQTSKGASLSNRTDAQEGQSTTANAIATAG